MQYRFAANFGTLSTWCDLHYLLCVLEVLSILCNNCYTKMDKTAWTYSMYIKVIFQTYLQASHSVLQIFPSIIIFDFFLFISLLYFLTRSIPLIYTLSLLISLSHTLASSISLSAPLSLPLSLLSLSLKCLSNNQVPRRDQEIRHLAF